MSVDPDKLYIVHSKVCGEGSLLILSFTPGLQADVWMLGVVREAASNGEVQS